MPENNELGEVYAGDIGSQDGILLEEKARREHEAIIRVTRCLPNPQRYVDICTEYMNKTTPEAKFIGQVDKLELALQAGLYVRAGHGGLDEFFGWAEERIKDPDLREIFFAIPKR